MNLDSKNLDSLIIWLHEFNYFTLQSEDDVETKFVIPLFEHLGYSSKYRRGKVPISVYNPGHRGRKPEADNVYFSTEEPNNQNENTTLLIVEAKEPHKQNLNEDVKQALFYAFYLKPAFYVVTNGISILIYRRHRYRSDECLFNCSVNAFRDASEVIKLYKQLNFYTVQQIKISAIDEVANSLYIEVIQLLKQKPDLLSQIEKGDFTNSCAEDEQRRMITISKPKVAIECQLPFVFKGGSCTIEFSNVMLRGLICHLTHDDIVHDLLIGLNTHPDWNTRKFIHKSVEGGHFEAQLGKTILLLSRQEIEELCACIDFVGGKYKGSLMSTETLLESWAYKFVQTFEIPGYSSLIQGFSLVSVQPWLWQLMMRFARAFDYLKGETDWHMFDVRWHSIRIHVHRQSLTNVVLWAIPADNRISMDEEWLSILYYDPDDEFRIYESIQKRSWREFVGPQGLWTVNFTQEWIMTCFIPKILSYYNIHRPETKLPFLAFQEWIAEKYLSWIFHAYSDHMKQKKEEYRQELLSDSCLMEKQNVHIPFSKINHLRQLADYLHDIQRWLLAYPHSMIDASLLRNYYSTFQEVAKHVESSTINVGYIQGKLSVAERDKVKTFPDEKAEDESEEMWQEIPDYGWVLHCLEKHAERIQRTNYESHLIAELIARAITAIIEDCSNYVSQELVNQATNTTKELWEQLHFEDKYIRY